MIRVVVVAGALALTGACTLLLPTDQIIQPCTSGTECKAGFACQDNACLPIDGEGEGEGEGE